MGSFFKKFFERKGFNVLISDIGTKLTNNKLVELSDVVFFSVPIHMTEKIIREVLPATRKDQLLMDCTSLKIVPMKAMLKSPAEVIGLHPMFRPSPLGLKKQTVVICVGRASKKRSAEIKNLFTDEGAQVVEMSAKEHDRLMSIIQVLLHFHTIALGHTMRKLGISLRKTLSVASPIYRLEMDMIGRIFSQDPLLYGAIEMYNPQSKKVMNTLVSEAELLADLVVKKDMNGFVKSFQKTATFLGRYKKEALEEINKLLVHLK